MGVMTEQAETIRTAILTVDDDPGVSRAVARDLRRRYGERYRIVRAESGADALEALRQMKLRGDLVAVILADYRMPGMNGIEFLERAMDIYPGARRVLLTAYADTGAAIDAINVVDLDHYLLKPWDPPEEKLYPVVDALLDAWLTSDHRPVPDDLGLRHRPVIGGQPRVEQRVDHRVELLLRRVPRLEQVVVEVDHVDGVDRGSGVGVGGEQHPPRPRVDVHRPLEELDPVHLGHPVVGQDHRHQVPAQLHLPQRIKRRRARLGPHDPVPFAVAPPQVTGDRPGYTRVVVDGEDRRSDRLGLLGHNAHSRSVL